MGETSRDNPHKGEIVVSPSSDFTDFSDPRKAANFRGLMQFQYDLPQEQVDQFMQEHLIKEGWKERASGLLAEVICQDSEYFGRIGQVMWADHNIFVGCEPIYRVGVAKAINDGIRKFYLCTKIDLILASIPEGCYRLIPKEQIGDENVEVVNDNGDIGRLLAWKPMISRGLRGIYSAGFGDNVVEKEDWLMMQEPTWQFRRNPSSSLIQK